ncbi:SDR family NAD(P)-dependent oxidoreductase [Rhodocyclus tenuis]|uniref:Short-subunit dehydrogenase n=1 Tax=Rhodocyclus tenuis TaxID=1066 RepID=A0A840GK69_RHOTE|nr:SDR family NAD(P)-dependent oxidoreductase [Rhodocyclus tenuis]MBB4248832.1 short-subunit dehydrogenase [Rhodocyclus tenuis]MBK1680788.1 short-chain dehydrogenase [Rhodocyclus tenuis]
MSGLNPAISDWRGQRVWLFGASTGIGAALARDLARRGARLALSARSADKLAVLAGEIAAAGGVGAPAPLLLPCDAVNGDSLARAWAQLLDAWGGVDVAIYLAGDYTPMHADAIDMAVARRLIDVNLIGAIAFTALVAPQLKSQRSGQIALTASVAGYCGLPKSLIYGASKAALINFTETLYLDLSPSGVGVRVINPGFVATPLTAQNDFSMPALQTPEQAAAAIVAGFATGDFAIDFPKRFTRVMKLLAHLPYRLFFPLVSRFTGL